MCGKSYGQPRNGSELPREALEKKSLAAEGNRLTGNELEKKGNCLDSIR